MGILWTIPATGRGPQCGGRARTRLQGAVGPAAFTLLLALQAPAGSEPHSRFPVTDEQRQTAEKVAQEGVPLSELAAGAPERYTIKRGDTLWGVSTLFLKSPWRWPELWGMNRHDIANPHLIYPGQTLVLVKTAQGRAQLKLVGAKDAGQAPAQVPAQAQAPASPELPVVRLSPRVRDEGDMQSEPIPSIPNRLIEPFLSQPKVVGVDELAKYPRIVATPEDRVFLGRGDLAYARGIDDPTLSDFHVFRPARPIYDPDDPDHKRKPIAYEAYFLGSAHVIKRGDVTTLVITDSREEIGTQDRLVPILREPLIAYVPHMPQRPVEGRLISVYGSIGDVGAESIVMLNRGAADGLQIGSVLEVSRAGVSVPDPTVPGRPMIKLPDERIGEMFVFRVYEGISYALVMTATGPIKIGDRFGQPEDRPIPSADSARASANLATAH